MRLYHLSFDLTEPLTRTFSPRIPGIPMPDENNEIPRICFSHSVLGCINAIPELDKNMSQNWNEEDCAAKAVLFSIDTKDIPASQFMDSYELYERGLVPDAVVNQECWCLSPLKLTGEIVNLCESSARNRLLHCAKESSREYVYSVIDKVCTGYASKNKVKLNDLSLFYIMNHHFNTAKMPYGYAADLDFEFCNIANISGQIDTFTVFPDFMVNDKLHSLRVQGTKYRAPFFDTSTKKQERLPLSTLITQAEVRKGDVPFSPVQPQKTLER